MHLRRATCLSLYTSLLITACDPGADGRPGADVRPDADALADATVDDSGPLDTVASTAVPTDASTIDPTDTTTSPTDTTASPTDAGTSNPTAADTASAPDTTLPIGGPCTSDQECASGACDVVPFFDGLCSACNEDADCADGGCTLGSPFADRPAICNDGALGAGCQDDAACQPGLVCTTVFDLGGLVPLSTCGTCRDDDDCPAETRCGARLDLTGWAGHRECIALGELPVGHPCDYDGGRDALCATAICAAVDVPPFGVVGVCGACHADGDCPGDAACQAGALDLGSGATAGSHCQ